MDKVAALNKRHHYQLKKLEMTQAKRVVLLRIVHTWASRYSTGTASSARICTEESSFTVTVPLLTAKDHPVKF